MRLQPSVFVGILVISALALTACSSSAASTSNRSTVPTTSEVLYEVVGGQKGASITMETPTGTSQQDVSIPLKKKSAGANDTGLTFTFDPGDFVYISAQGRGGSNNVICRISVNGKVISQNTATGYGIATCKGKA